MSHRGLIPKSQARSVFGWSQLDLNIWLGGRATSTRQLETRSRRMRGRETEISSCGKVTLKRRGVTGGQCRNEEFNCSRRDSKNWGKCPNNCSAAAAGEIFPESHKISVMEMYKSRIHTQSRAGCLGKTLHVLAALLCGYDLRLVPGIYN